MEYQVEDLSQVKKKISVSVDKEEVNAALTTTLALYRRDADMPGFRKGKVPSSLIEAKFKKQITTEATTDLINAHLNQILGELKLTPASKLDVDTKNLEKDQAYDYSFSFEFRPTIDLPEYRGLEAEQEMVEVKESDVDEVILKLQNNLAKPVPMTETRKPQKGDITVIDFKAFDENGGPMEGLKAINFELPLGEGQALPEFEAIITKLNTGETGEDKITFPADFLNPKLAGKTVTMQITLHAIKIKKLPEVNDEFAKLGGGFESLDKLKEAIRNSYKESRTQVVKSAAQKSLIDQLNSKIDCVLPESMVESQTDAMVQDLIQRLERRGKGIESLGKTPDALRETYRPGAQEIVKSQLVLLSIAEKEGLDVTPQEMDQHLQQMAIRSGQEAGALKEYYIKNNLMFALKDNLLSDKAMDLVYQNAAIKEVPAKDLKPKGDDQETEKPKKKKASK